MLPQAISNDRSEQYRKLADQLRGLLGEERDPVANAANMAAFLMMMLPDLNWVGFYFMHGKDELIVGPFQGKPACVRIPVGKGVCGTAVAKRASQVVDDVHAFAGHIACDAGSASELVVPIFDSATVVGVLDFDSPTKGRFDQWDRAGAEALVEIFSTHSDLMRYR
ncbi:MAG: GAF domain-containing protein [Clostridia bacterium]|nr:GAF domain-containing protein [Deltaproteobacteria bacterium]